MGPDAMIFIFWMWNFKPAFSLSSFLFIKKLCSSSSLSAIRVTSSTYLRLFISACASSILAFSMMYSAYKLNKQGDNISRVPWCTPFPIWERIRWRSWRTCAHLILQELHNCNSLLNNHRQENIGSHQEKIPHVQGQRRSPNKTVGQAKSWLESNPIFTRDTLRAQTKPYACQDQAIPQRLSQTWHRVFECLLWSHWSAVAWHRDRGSGCSRAGSHSVWAPPWSRWVSPMGEPHHGSPSRWPTN